MESSRRNLGVVIQARLGSTRLPKKVLKIIDGIPLIVLVYRRITRCLNVPVVVATTDSLLDDELVSILSEYNIRYYRGSENDVLLRFINTAHFFGFTDVMRVCADNPFIDGDYLKRLNDFWDNNNGVDYLSFSYFNTPVIKTHFGIFSEIANVNALQRVFNNYKHESSYYEHVTLGLYSNPNSFNIKLIEIGNELEKYEGIRLTIDTEMDYQFVTQLYSNFYNRSFKEIGDFILSQKEIFEKMKALIQENKK